MLKVACQLKILNFDYLDCNGNTVQNKDGYELKEVFL